MKSSIFPLLGLGLLLVLAGCAPAISSGFQQEAAPINFAALEAQPGPYQGRLVVLGGEVMTVQPWGKGSLLTVNQTALDAQGRPIDGAPSGGTFMVQSDRPLNPDEYVAQRKVTVAGEVKGRQDRWPLLAAREIHLWENPYRLVAVPPRYYNHDKTLEHWYTPPYFNPYITEGQ